MSRIFTDAENDAWAKTLPGKMTSACLILRQEDTVLMVKASYKDHWTFPSGIVDDGESPKAAALREAMEETGISLQPDECTFLTVVYTSSNGHDRDRFNFAYLSESAPADPTLSVPNDEIDDAEWVPIIQVAEKSGNKGSYATFMRFLLDPASTLPYVEITPKKK